MIRERAVAIHDELSIELINKSLEKYGITFKGMIAKYGSEIIPTGVIKNKKPITDHYTMVYVWESEDEYLKWREWALERVEQEEYTRWDLDAWELAHDLKHQYIFKKEGELF